MNSRTMIKVGFSLFLLNLVLSFTNFWPTPLPLPTLRLSGDLFLLLGLWFGAGWRNPRLGTIIGKTLPAILMILVLGHYIQTTAPTILGRDVQLAFDLPLLPDALTFVWQGASAKLILPWLLGLVLVVVFMVILVYWPLKTLRNLHPTGATASLTLSVAILAFALPDHQFYGGAPSPFGFWYRQWDEVRDLPPFKMKGVATSDFKNLQQKDVGIFFFESYGMCVFNDPRFSSSFQPTLIRAEESLQKDRWHVASARIVAPTMGGNSYLSHASLMVGMMVRDPRQYRQFIATNPPHLIDQFKQAGYFSVGLFPGIKMIWPEGQSYHFDSIISAKNIRYAGPGFGWWHYPDQATLVEFERSFSEIDRPKLIFFPTLTSHLPWSPLPIYQEDWSKFLTDQPYPPEVLAKIDQRPDWGQVNQSYLQSLNYNWQWLDGFRRRHLEQWGLIMVLGDHQPPVLLGSAPEDWTVPIHILSPDAKLVAAFRDQGFTAGLTPNTKVWGEMAAITDLVLKVLDQKASSPLNK